MAVLRQVFVLAFLLGSAVVALSPRRRAAVARKLERARAFVSHRVVDRDARELNARDTRDALERITWARAHGRAAERWDDDGGAR